MGERENKSEQISICEKLNSLELIIKNNQNPLDSPITDKELKGRLQALQSGKVCGPDGIPNEMLKYSSNKLQESLLKLFNLILSVGYFPEIGSNKSYL